MSYLRTSISILVLATSLTLCLTPKIAFADDAPVAAPDGGVIGGVAAMKKNTEHRDDQLGELDRQRAAAQANAEKNRTQPQTTAHIDTGGQSGFTPQPAPQPESPSTASAVATWCWNAVCTVVKTVSGVGAVEAIYDAATKQPDEAKEYERHKEDVHKLVEEKQKAEEQKKVVEQPKTVAPKSSDVKSAEVKTVESKSSKSVVIPAPKPDTRVVSFEAPKARTLTISRPTVTTLSHVEVNRPALNIVRPTVNVPHPTVHVPQPTIRIPTIVAHR